MPRAAYTFDQVATFLSRIGPELSKTLPRLVDHMAKRIQHNVKTRYQQFDEQPKGLSALVLQHGKEFGPMSQRPAKVPGLVRGLFGMLAQHVIVRRISRGKRWRISLDPTKRMTQATKRHPYGPPLSFMAYVNEARKGGPVPFTLLMQSYIIMLREGRGGWGTRKGGRHLTTNYTKGTVLMIPKERPVWSYVIKRKVPLHVRTLIIDVFRTLDKIAMGAGGKRL